MGKCEMTVDENLQLAIEFVDACNGQDWNRFVAFFADEAFGASYAAHEENRWMRAFPDTRWEIVNLTAQEDRVVIQGIVRLTHAGELTFWVKDRVPATNRKVAFQHCGVARCEEGKFVEYTNYFSQQSSRPGLLVVAGPDPAHSG